MATIAEMLVRLGVDAAAFSAGIERATADMNKAERDFQRSFGGIEQAGMSLATVGAGLAATVTAPLIGVGIAAVRVSEDLNMARLAFTTMLGSAEAANGFLTQLADFASKTPFEFPDLVTAAKRMMAMGFTAQQVVPTLTAIGDAAAALGGGAAFIDGVTTALGQMQAKGKVSAQEMNQLAERGVPAWSMLASAIGTSIPQAMKLAEKGAIEASVAIPAILDGMNQRFGGQMATASRTLTGVWSNFKDQVTMILAEVGAKLTPILLSLLNAAMPLLDWARQAIEWFTALPAPIQTFAVALAGIAAAVGPMLVALGGAVVAVTQLGAALAPLAAVLGTSALALGGWAVAIAAALAALVALGTWVYSNWEPIKATVLYAWSGITEAWQAAWNSITQWLLGLWNSLPGWVQAIFGGILNYYIGLWEAVKTVFSVAWTGISNALAMTWEGIKTAAAAIWNHITSQIEAFITVAKKIPGVNKLFTLDEAWNNAKKLGAESQAAAAAVNSATTAAKKASPALVSLGNTAGAAGNKIKTAREHVKKFNDEILLEKYRIWNQEKRELAQTIARLQVQIEKTGPSTLDLSRDFGALAASIEKTADHAGDVAKIKMPAIMASMNAATPPVNAYREALEKLGITSKESLQKVADEAAKARDVVLGSGLASDFEQKTAIYKALKAQVEAARAAGQEISSEQERLMARLESEIGGANGVKKLKDHWDGFGKQVSTIITNTAQDMAKALFDGDLSFGEKFKKMAQSLGQAVISTFVEPATQAIANFITGIIQDLLGGRGLGGVIDSLREVGTAFRNVFGGASAAAGAAGSASGAGSAGGAAGSAGSASGSAAGGADGLFGIINLVSGIVTAAASVVSAIVEIRQEGTLNAIEHEVRYSQIHLSHLLEKANAFWPKVDSLVAVGIAIDSKLAEMGAYLGGGLTDRIMQLHDLIANTTNEHLRAIAEAVGSPALAVAGGGTLEVNLHVQADTSDEQRIADAVVRALERMGIRA